ncbi:MAG: cytochrome b/b6 domain-containing protein [Chloroflexi bacterium]|nr:cytochrome b/b6 domain-containing protein [Chloroflexota bacterium]
MAVATGATFTVADDETAVSIRRFDVHQVTQHGLLAGSFILLTLTGLPLKFHDAALSQWWVSLWGGIEAMRNVHHFAAWVMVLDCAYHLLYLGVTILILKRPFPYKMIPGPQDFVNFFDEMRWFLGLRKDRPRFDRFNWREKFDYWAIFWGMPVMAGSGFVLMYPVLVTQLLPGWIIPTAYVAHSDEAMLAIVWIMLMHVYFAHFPPGAFPVNTTMFTGKMSVERYRLDHPAEYEEMFRIPTRPEKPLDEADIAG